MWRSSTSTRHRCKDVGAKGLCCEGDFLGFCSSQKFRKFRIQRLFTVVCEISFILVIAQRACASNTGFVCCRPWPLSTSTTTSGKSSRSPTRQHPGQKELMPSSRPFSRTFSTTTQAASSLRSSRRSARRRSARSRRCVIPITKSLWGRWKSCSRQGRERRDCGCRVCHVFWRAVADGGVVLELNGDLQKSGNGLTSVMREQIEAQRTLENIDEAIDTLKVVCPVECHLLTMPRSVFGCWAWQTEFTNSSRRRRATPHCGHSMVPAHFGSSDCRTTNCPPQRDYPIRLC
jgi:hypothetical protein